MARATQKRGGLEIDGLAESIRALKKLDPGYRKEAVQIMRDVATDVQHRAQAKIGTVGRYPKRKGIIGRSATGAGAAVKLRASKYPWAYGAEYGEVIATVFDNNIPQRRFRRRTFGTFKPPTSSDMFKNTGGYMIQPVIRARLPWIEKTASEDMTRLIDKAMRRAGVPRGT